MDQVGISFKQVRQFFMLRERGRAQAVEALGGVSLDIGRAQFIALVGPSGCGKTTLLNIAAGLLSPQSGVALINGKPPAAGRPDVAYMLARDAMLPWRTAIGNVEYGLELRGERRAERRERARELLQAVGLGRYENAYRSELSHGMRQRVALARTFALKSEILLMDEPYGALDIHLKIQLGDLLLKLWDKDRRTVMFVTHDLHEAISLADRVVVMCPNPGRVIADVEIPLERPRSLSELQTDPRYHELYSRIWSLMSHGHAH